MKNRNGKPKIAMFGHKRIPSREGGAEVVAGHLCVSFSAKGYDVTSFNRWSDRKSSRQKYYKGVRLRYVPTVRTRGLSAALAAFGAALATAVGNYDIVHIHSEGPAATAFLPHFAGKRTVVTIHGLDHQRAKWGRFASWCLKMGEKSAVRYADEIIVLSRNVQQYFRDQYGRETIYIPNGASVKENVPADRIRRTWGLAKDSYVLYLGRLVPEKGLQYLLEAWRGISGGIKLVVAGGSSDTDEFVERMRRAAGPDVIFTGFVKGRVLEELYSNARIYVLPSDLEGMPLTLLEAMSYGNCCLTSDIPECVEAAGGRAVSFRKSDADDLRVKLQDLLSHPEKVELYRKEAREYIKDNYSWEKCAEQMLAVYRGIDEKGDCCYRHKCI